MKIENFQIDQPIIIDDLTNIIINTPGVVSLIELKIINIRGTSNDREYSDVAINIDASTFRRMIIGPPGAIFELRYADHDIVGTSL